MGDRATAQRYALKSVAKEADKIKPIETVAGAFLFQVIESRRHHFSNLEKTDLPFVFDYSLVADNYAKAAGGLLLVRPRVLGVKSSDLLETKEARAIPSGFRWAFARFRYV